jgi:hypothetical protein
MLALAESSNRNFNLENERKAPFGEQRQPELVAPVARTAAVQGGR